MRLLSLLLCVGLAFPALAQQPEKRIHLDLTTQQTMLIVETLGQISCQRVSDMPTCETARDALKAIQEQAKQQGN